MELRPGYKQTEVGVIPEDWEVRALAILTNKIGDGLHGTPRYSPEGAYSFINGNNLVRGRIEITPDTRAVSHEEFQKHGVPLGASTLLMSINGTIGNTAMYHGEPVVLGKSAAYLNVLPRVSRIFLYYCLGMPLLQRHFSDAQTGTTIKNLGLAAIRASEIPLPPLPEQKAIAEALSDVDALIESQEQLIAKKKQIKQGTMQELLTGKRRLPGFSGEWEENKLGEVAALRVDRATPTIQTAGRVVELDDIESGSGKLSADHFGPQSVSLKSVFNPGDVLFGKLRAYLRKYWLCDSPGLCSTEFWVLIPRQDKVSSEYLFEIVQTRAFVEAATLSSGTHMPRSDWKIVKELLLKLPSIAEQTAIAAVLSEMDSEISTLEQKLSKTRAIKQGMMQELLTGRIRLV